MAYPKFKELELNKKTVTVALLQSIEEAETKTGKPYLNLSISDGEQTVVAKLWDTTKDALKVTERTLITVELYPKLYQEKVSYEAYRYGNAPADARLEDYIVHAPYAGEAMYQGILTLIKKECGDAPLYTLVEKLFEENKEKLLYWSAAKGIHHNYCGGLLYHTFRMVREACMTTRVYPFLQKDVLLAGVALHDIGKLEELETDRLGVADYTVDGSLFTHAYLGMRMVEEAAKVLKTPEDQTRQVLHIIASHHGNLEWGAITVPATAEALAVHHIDMMDSRFEQFEKVLTDMEPGTMSDKVFGLGTKVYKPIAAESEMEA